MKSLMTALICMVFAAPALSQEFAKARLEKSPRHLEYVKVKQGSREITCFVAYPEVKSKATAVLVIHEIFGLSDWVRSVADQLAEAGYVAIAPDLLSGMAPGGGGTKELGDRDGVTRAVMGLPAEQVTADLHAVAAYVTGLPASNGKLVVAGFCWGGGQSFRYATNNPKVKAAFVFYGPQPNEADMAKIQAPVYGFYGGNDARINATIPATTDKMKAAGKSYDPVIYEGAGHGFMRGGEDPAGREGDKKARDEGWKRWKELLEKASK